MTNKGRRDCKHQLWLGDLDDHFGLNGIRLLGEASDIRTLDLAVHGLSDYAGDLVWVAVGGGAAVLEVALVFRGDGTGNADGGATVGNAPGELVI